LADARSLPALKALALSPDVGIRTAAVWALGRLAVADAAPLLSQAAQDRRQEVAALACLGLGRLKSWQRARQLADVAADFRRPDLVRRAAILGIGLAELSEAGPMVLPFLDSSRPALVEAAATTLGAIKDRRTLRALWQRALVGRGPESGVATKTLRMFMAPAGMPDEAFSLRGGQIDVERLLAALSVEAARATTGANRQPTSKSTSGPEWETLWIEHSGDVADVLLRALDGSTESQIRALTALGSRRDGPGLAKLVDRDDMLSPEAEAALTAIGARVRDRVASLLGEPDREVRRLALGVASKLRDPRVQVSHVYGAILDSGDLPGDAGSADEGPAWEVAARVLVTHVRVSGAALARGLAGLLVHPSWTKRLAFVRTVRVAGKDARPQLELALRDSNPFVRAAAADALSQDALATPALLAAARDGAAAVRKTVARALLGRSGREATAALQRLARDEAPSVRAAASGQAR
jgi:HEAT repeat protein